MCFQYSVLGQLVFTDPSCELPKQEKPEPSHEDSTSARNGAHPPHQVPLCETKELALSQGSIMEACAEYAKPSRSFKEYSSVEVSSVKKELNPQNYLDPENSVIDTFEVKSESGSCLSGDLKMFNVKEEVPDSSENGNPSPYLL